MYSLLWRVWRETRDCESSSLVLFFVAHELSELAIEYVFSLFGEEFSSTFVAQHMQIANS